jgi:hypothetical protein
VSIEDLPAGSCDRANGLEVVVAVRLIQIGAYATDAAATPFTSRAEKSRLIDELLAATAEFPAEFGMVPHLAPLARLAHDDTLVASLEAIAQDLSPRLTDREKRLALIEAVASTSWPKGIAWVADRSAVLAEAASLFMPPVGPEEIEGIEKSYRAAAKRLQKDSKSPGAQAAQVGVTAALAAVSGGAATGIGTFLGTHFLGLSGAAATSAGLALFGGGSLASGGFGMAGGLLLLHSSMTAAKFGGQQALSRLASASPSAFLDSLAKLDVLVVMDPGLLSEIITYLEGMEVELRTELKAVQPKDLVVRRTRIAKSLLRGVASPAAIPGVVRDVQTEVSSEERDLMRALRAVDFELRHLRSPDWKRAASYLSRVMGVPSASKLLDRY